MSTDSLNAKVKLGGWLIVVGILLWVGVISAFVGILEIFGWPAVRNRYPADVLLNTSVITFILYVPMLAMFHQRRAALVKWVVVLAIHAVLEECYIQYSEMNTTAGHVVAVVFEVLLMTGVVMYFLKSKRVKRTFVR